MTCSKNSIIGRNGQICWECITPIQETPDIQKLIFDLYGDRSICVYTSESDCIFIKKDNEEFSENDIEDIKNFLVSDEKRNRNDRERMKNLETLESASFWSELEEAVVVSNEKGYYHYKTTPESRSSMRRQAERIGF